MLGRTDGFVGLIGIPHYLGQAMTTAFAAASEAVAKAKRSAKSARKLLAFMM